MAGRARTILSVFTLSLAALLLCGCQSTWLAHDAKSTPMFDELGHARSGVLPSKQVRMLGWPDGAEADTWYAQRNDAQLTVNAGYRTTEYEAQRIVTRDQQYTTSGRVYGNYQRRTYRTTIVGSRQ